MSMNVLSMTRQLLNKIQWSVATPTATSNAFETPAATTATNSDKTLTNSNAFETPTAVVATNDDNTLTVSNVGKETQPLDT